MQTFDDENLIWQVYRNVPPYQVRYFGNFFRCLKIDKLTRKQHLYKTWIDSSSKSDLPPDFHNDKHKVMMEFMRIDDSSENCKNNSFKRQSKLLEQYFGSNYKNENKSCISFVVSDTRDNSDFNYKGYISNFERVVLAHSEKIKQYKENYPKCKSVILFICDESNNYIEVANKEDLQEKEYYEKFKIHYAYADKNIIDIIKRCKADFVIWFGLYKYMTIDGKRVLYPRVVIYDLKNLKYQGFKYNEELMYKVTKE